MQFEGEVIWVVSEIIIEIGCEAEDDDVGDGEPEGAI